MLYLRSPIGGCCSISDDLSCSDREQNRLVQSKNYRGMFEVQNSGNYDKLRKMGLNKQIICKSIMGRDQKSGGVIVPCLHIIPVKNPYSSFLFCLVRGDEPQAVIRCRTGQLPAGYCKSDYNCYPGFVCSPHHGISNGGICCPGRPEPPPKPKVHKG